MGYCIIAFILLFFAGMGTPMFVNGELGEMPMPGFQKLLNVLFMSVMGTPIMALCVKGFWDSLKNWGDCWKHWDKAMKDLDELISDINQKNNSNKK